MKTKIFQILSGTAHENRTEIKNRFYRLKTHRFRYHYNDRYRYHYRYRYRYINLTITLNFKNWIYIIFNKIN